MAGDKKYYAVAFICFSENELRIECIEATTWQEAAKAHSHSCFSHESITDDDIGVDVQTAKTFAFDCDHGFDVQEILWGNQGSIDMYPPGTPTEYVKLAAPEQNNDLVGLVDVDRIGIPGRDEKLRNPETPDTHPDLKGFDI